MSAHSPGPVLAPEVLNRIEKYARGHAAEGQDVACTAEMLLASNTLILCRALQHPLIAAAPELLRLLAEVTDQAFDMCEGRASEEMMDARRLVDQLKAGT